MPRRTPFLVHHMQIKPDPGRPICITIEANSDWVMTPDDDQNKPVNGGAGKWRLTFVPKDPEHPDQVGPGIRFCSLIDVEDGSSPRRPA